MKKPLRSLPMKKVLIVDDAAFMRLSIKTMIEKNGFEVAAEAENGIQGIKKFKEFMPDIVTMDITMPDLTGIEALKEIKKIDPNAKIVMLSAMGQEDMVREAIMQGAISFIVKPFKEEQLIATLNKILK
jgi:two-component system chemotaxis response regulator CheY